MNRNTFLLLLGSLFPAGLPAQVNEPVRTVDLVRVKSGHRPEALFFYENNWKPARDTALAKGYISGYRLMETMPDSLGNFDLMLMTTYPDSVAFAKREERFQAIIKALSPDGPKLLNDLKPGEFRENAYSENYRTVFAVDAVRKVKLPSAGSSQFLEELNRDIWIPFMEAYATDDADKYLSLHTDDFIRAQGDGQSITDLAGYSERTRAGFQRGKEQGGERSIEFSFFERFSDGQTASERGIYKYSYKSPKGQAWTGYGQFHVFSRKVNGRWKIVVDYDSSEGRTVGEVEFNAGRRTEEW